MDYTPKLSSAGVKGQVAKKVEEVKEPVEVKKASKKKEKK